MVPQLDAPNRATAPALLEPRSEPHAPTILHGSFSPRRSPGGGSGDTSNFLSRTRSHR